jgi:hypothetical protein
MEFQKNFSSELHDNTIPFCLSKHYKVFKLKLITESICWLLKAFTGIIAARTLRCSYRSWSEKWAVIEVHDPLNLESINGNQFQLMAIHLKVSPDYSKIQLVAILLRVHSFVCPRCDAYTAEWPHRRSHSSVCIFELQAMSMYLRITSFLTFPQSGTLTKWKTKLLK